MRPAAVALVAALVAGCGGDPAPEAPPPARTEVRVTLDVDGPAGPLAARTVRLACPSPADAVACRALESLPAPVPADVACTEIFGGPETGRVVGTVDGRRVDAVFSRSNGCEIDRFDRAQPVLDLAR